MRFWVYHCLTRNGNPLFIEAEDKAGAERFFGEMRESGPDHAFDVSAEDIEERGYEIRVVGKDEGLKPDPTTSEWTSAPVILVGDRKAVLSFGNPAHSATFGMFRRRVSATVGSTTGNAYTILLERPSHAGPSTWTLKDRTGVLLHGTDRIGMESVVTRLLRLCDVEPGFRNNFCAFLQKRLVRSGEYAVVPEDLNAWADQGGPVYEPA